MFSSLLYLSVGYSCCTVTTLLFVLAQQDMLNIWFTTIPAVSCCYSFWGNTIKLRAILWRVGQQFSMSLFEHTTQLRTYTSVSVTAPVSSSIVRVRCLWSTAK